MFDNVQFILSLSVSLIISYCILALYIFLFLVSMYTFAMACFVCAGVKCGDVPEPSNSDLLKLLNSSPVRPAVLSTSRNVKKTPIRKQAKQRHANYYMRVNTHVCSNDIK